jgi:hypothetical protein
MIHVDVHVGVWFWFHGHSGVQGECRSECFALLFVLKHENSFHSYYAFAKLYLIHLPSYTPHITPWVA